MRLMSRKDEELYAQLVELAGGKSDIVMEVLSQPNRRSVDLGTVVDEILQKKRELAAKSRESVAVSAASSSTYVPG